MGLRYLLRISGRGFLANCLSYIKDDKPFTILVATSGDTGSAVAAAFHGKKNIRVVVMFPKGKIFSTTRGSNYLLGRQYSSS